jgi:hypothetical protein
MGWITKSPAQKVAKADVVVARAVRDANADLERRAGITHRTVQAEQLDRDVAEAKAATKGR